MTKEEVKALIKAKIEGQGTNVDAGSVLPAILNGILDLIDGGGGTSDAVQYIPQTLTEAQQMQARTNIGAGTYSKASEGIPKTDLASAVQDSLGKADTAIQPAEFNELEEEVGTIGNGAYEEAWDGSSAPVVANIPAGVSVTYNGTSYTGTLAASASTVDKIYLVSDGNGNYDRYVTIENSGTYSWKKVGTTAIPLSDYATKTEVSQLEADVNGKTILSYSGAQSIRTLDETVTQNTLALIKITGNPEDINDIAFLGSDSTNLLDVVRVDFKEFVVAIPQNTAKVGIYQKAGKTLNITITITIIGLEQERELSNQEKGIIIDGLAWTSSICSLYNSVKCIRFYAPGNRNIPYLRLFGFYTNKLQMSVSYNKNTNIDFTAPASERPTGLKTHILKNGDSQIAVTVDWDVFTSNFADNNYRLGIFLNDYSGAIIPTINEKIDKSVQELDLSRIKETSEQAGEGIGASNFNNSWIYCPNKSFTKDGYLSEIGFKAGADCTLTVYVGELDQRYLFIPRSSHSFACISGDNVLDVESQKIAVYAGEFIAFRASTGGVKFNNATAGDPLSENSFLYSANNSTNLFQLQVYGAQKIFKINFYAKTTTDVFIQQTLESLKLQAQISTMGETVGSISSSLGIVNDAQGNKYRLKVVSGAVVAVPLNFRNVLCVGNSFTVHPTTTDTGAAFVTSYWWGHWAMAASSPNVAWPKLLQNALRVKQNDAVVTPIFGRPYETGAYALTDDDAFVYWESGTRKSLKANLASFSGVDCIVFFLGDNYTGSDWETKFNAMCEQFATWFPSASIYCVGAVVSSSVSSAIQNVAGAKGYPFIDVLSIKTQPLRSREGNFVLGDDNALHQINYSAVGNHFGDYGQFKLNEKIATALGVTPVAVAYAVTLESQLLTLLQYNYLEDSIVSIFADDTVNSITVVDADNNAITATSHSTDYGKIFTFTMPASDVSVSAVTS